MQLFVIQGLPSPPVNLWDELYSTWLVPIGEDGAISLSMSKRMKVKVCKLSSAKKVRKMRMRVRNRNMEMERKKEMGRQVLASTPMLGTARFETAPPHYLMQRIIIITIHQTHQYKSWIGRDPKALGALESW